MRKIYKETRLMVVLALSLIASLSIGQEAVNTAFRGQTGEFSVAFDVVPSHSPMNGGVGLSDGEVGTWADMSCIIGFHQMGLLRAYNGTEYQKENDIAFSADSSYHFIMDVDVPNQTYSVQVVVGEDTTTLATDYAFRKAVTELNNYASYNDTNPTYGGIAGATMDVTNFPIPELTFAKVYTFEGAAPQIDGDFSDWDGIEKHSMDYVDQGVETTPEDYSAYWKAVWKNGILYMMAEITDDTLYNEGSPWWNHDAINFYFGVANERNGTGIPDNDNHYLYEHWWGQADNYCGKAGDIEGAEVKKTDLDNGWAIEWKIPMDSLDMNGAGTEFVEGTRILFDVVAVDDDNATDPYLTRSWSKSPSNWVNMDETGVIELAGLSYPKAKVYTVENAPVIDGDLSDWAGIPKHSMDYVAQGVETTPEDFSAYWKACWKDGVMYMMAKIKDDKLYNEGSAYWNHDAVNFYFGVANARNGEGIPGDPNHYIYEHWWGQADDYLGAAGGIDGAEVKKFDLADGSGWAIEWKIPLDSLDMNDAGIVWEEGTKFLFDVIAVDDDDATDPYLTRGWSESPSAYGDMSNLGEVELAGLSYPKAKIYTTETVPVIDGDFSDWDSFDKHSMDYVAQGVETTSEDFSAYWKACWKDGVMYMMAEIKDDTLYNEGSAFWNHDAVNFYFGVANARNGKGIPGDPNHYIYEHWWGQANDYLGAAGGIDGAEVKKIDLADGSGWAIEWKVPLDSLDMNGAGTVWEEGTKFLFDVIAVDDDDPTDPYLTRGWSESPSAYGDMSNLGEVELAGSAYPKATIYTDLTPPEIDGDFSDWDGIEKHDMNFVAQGVETTPEDYSAYWKAVWNDGVMYIMAQINDDELYNEGSPFWNHDAINFYFGVANERDGTGVPGNDNHYIYEHWWGQADDYCGAAGNIDGAKVKKIDLADGSGWAIEWKVPMDSLDMNGAGTTFGDGTTILFDVVAVDDDNATDPWLSRGWSENESNWVNMNRTGEITFSSEVVSTNQVFDFNFNVYPNPFNGNLSIVSEEDIKNISIYSTLGNKLFNQEIENFNHKTIIDMSNAPKGIYFLKVTLTDGSMASRKISKN